MGYFAEAPLYDSVFVRPRKQLREVESSSVLKFFVNVQGKTKLETNMQSASLLPHWNTFEARALRVVISDLPASFPEAVEKCIKEPNGTADDALLTLTRCLEDLSNLIKDEKQRVTEQLPKVEKCVNDFAGVVKKAGEIKQDLDGCLSKFKFLPDQQTAGCLLQLQSKLRTIYSDLVEWIKGIRISKAKRDKVEQIASQIDALSDTEEEKGMLGQLDLCLQAFRQLIVLTNQIKKTSLEEVQTGVNAVKQFIQTDVARVERLEKVKACLMNVQAELKQLKTELR